MLRSAQASPVTSYDWIEYFYQNANEPALPWDDGHRLSPAERAVIVSSIRRFGVDEIPDPELLISRAKEFARENGDRGFFYAFRLLMREEARQSRILARFLGLEGVPRAYKRPSELILHGIRFIAGMDTWMIVLATAEVIARCYYDALRDATKSRLLHDVCELMLKEEAAHLRFRRFALKNFQDRLSPRVRSALRRGHNGFLLASLAVVWVRHHRVFQAGSRSLRQVLRQGFAELDSLYNA